MRRLAASFVLFLLAGCSEAGEDIVVPPLEDVGEDSTQADTTTPDTTTPDTGTVEDTRPADASADSQAADASESGASDTGPTSKCGAPLVECGGGDAGEAGASFCADTRFDPNNCGTCANKCPSGQLCVDSMCKTSCPVGQIVCNGKCVDTTNDPANCGGCTADPTCTPGGDAGTCTTKCLPGQFCSSSVCSATCGAGQTVCGERCATTTIDPANCGGCGNEATGDKICGNANTTASFCQAGECKTTCATNFGDCDGKASTGCEVKLDDRPDHCGKCANDCAGRPNTTATAPTCAAAVCKHECVAGYGDCKPDTVNAPAADLGCETKLDTIASCGACGTVCAEINTTAATCEATGCKLTCKAGFADCDGNPSNGCEADLSLADNCGSCGTKCEPTNGTGTCRSGACFITACNAGFYDCDRRAQDGCEATTAEIGTSTCPAPSCAAIKRAVPSATTGTYKLDPSGGANLDAFDAHCDMTTANGGWTLVGRSVANVATTSFGWRYTNGSLGDLTVPYSLNAYEKRLAVNELLFGNRNADLTWGTNVYRLGVPSYLVTALPTDAVRTSVPWTTVAGTCTPATNSMLQWAGQSNLNTAFFLRDNASNGTFGLRPNGFVLQYDTCSQGADLNLDEGMMMVRSPACSATQLDCGFGCTDPLTDDANCGGCGIACGTNQVCSNAVCRDATNVALAGTASQSTDLDTTNVASRAIDGILNNLQHTQNGAGQWWQVDLGSDKPIFRVDLWNRVDCCQTRATNLLVQTSSDATNWDDTPLTGVVGFPTNVAIGKTARYVRIVQTQANWLDLAEVRVWEIGTTCGDTQTSSNNCGACGKICKPSETCSAGACVAATKTCAEAAAESGFTPGPMIARVGNTAVKTYCDTDGWQLVLKADGSLNTFAYASELWTNEALLNPASNDLSKTEAKLDGFNVLPFQQIRVGFDNAGTTKYATVSLAAPATSLRSALSQSTSTPFAVTGTTEARTPWLTALDGSGLQLNCNAAGLNVGSGSMGARIGIVGNEGTDGTGGCGSPDSVLGVGARRHTGCGYGTGATAYTGNMCSCGPCAKADATNVTVLPQILTPFTWVFVK